jgi:hypothetical protein
MTITLANCGKDDNAKMISSGGSIAESVFLTHDDKSNPVVAWTEKQNDNLSLIYAISDDDGKSFSNKVIIPLSNDVATHAESMPKVAFKNDGTVVAAYEKKAPTKENKFAGAIYYIVSSDRGKTWTKETFLHTDTVPGLSRSYFDIETLPDGEIGASWLDIKIDNETGGRTVKFAKTNASNGFTNEILVDSSACQCCRIDVYTDDSENVFVAYRGLKKGQMGKQVRDMMIATSTDRGATFSSPILISADNWNIDGCPHTGPSLCSNKAGLFSLWYTEGSGTGIYLTQKSKDENAFVPRQLVSNEGHHPQLCSNDNRIAMLWEENLDFNGKAKTIIKYRIVEDGVDIETKSLTKNADNSFLPVVTRFKDGFIIAYLKELDGGEVAVYLLRI